MSAEIFKFNRENKRKAKTLHATKKELERKLRRSKAINRALLSDSFIAGAIIGLIGFALGALLASKN